LFHPFHDGSITLKELARGMHLSYLNARSLLKDAQALARRDSPRALALGILAMEETGKVFLLANHAADAAKGTARWGQIKKELKSHEFKQIAFASYGKSLLSKPRKPYYKTEVSLQLVKVDQLLKQLSFYVDCADGKFTSPHQSKNPTWRDDIINAVKERLDSVHYLHRTEERSYFVARQCAMMGLAFEQGMSEAELLGILSKVRRSASRVRTKSRSRVSMKLSRPRR
jgi:AbiV family abortive infection protein